MLPPSKVTRFRKQFASQVKGLILDCAAGTGAFRSFFDTNDIVSFDLNYTQIDNLEGKKVCGDARKMPFKDDSFDNIWACGLVHYIETSLEEYISEWGRVAKSKGKIYILTPNRHSPFNIFHYVGLKAWKYRENVVRLYGVSDLRKYGKVSGEIQFISFLNPLLKIFPSLGHTLMLEINVSELKKGSL